MTSFVLTLADATLNPAAAFLTVYLTGTVITLRTWPPRRPPSRREAARATAHRRALLAAVKARWANA